MILIAGSNGHVGKEIVKKAVARGLRLCCFDVRPLELPGVDTSGLDIVIGSVTDPAAVASAMRGVTVALFVIGIKDRDKGVTHEMVEHGGIRNIIQAGKQTGVKHIMYISSLGARADSPARSQSAKWNTEQTLIASGIPYTIFRPSAYFVDVTEHLVPPLQKTGSMTIIGDGQYRIQPLDPADLAEAFLQAIDNQKAINKVFKISGEEVFTQAEMIQLAGRMLGIEARIKKLPYGPLNFAFTLLALLTGRRALKDFLYRMSRHSVCTAQEMQEVRAAFNIEFKRLEPWLREQLLK